MLMATFESKREGFFKLPNHKVDYFEHKKAEENLGKQLAENIFKNLNKGNFPSKEENSSQKQG